MPSDNDLDFTLDRHLKRPPVDASSAIITALRCGCYIVLEY